MPIITMNRTDLMEPVQCYCQEEVAYNLYSDNISWVVIEYKNVHLNFEFCRKFKKSDNYTVYTTSFSS